MPFNMVPDPWPLYIYSQGVACFSLLPLRVGILACASHLGLRLAMLCSR
jgi:hypothetical protein